MLCSFACLVVRQDCSHSMDYMSSDRQQLNRGKPWHIAAIASKELSGVATDEVTDQMMTL